MPTKTETFPTLYKIGANDQILQWNVSVEPYVPDSDPYPTYGEIVIEHGQVDGKKITDKEMVTEGKNVGKKNETSPWDQAVSQAKSRWKKQHDKGYRETIGEATDAASLPTAPMLAHKLVDKAHKLVVGRVYGEQPKLDGMRCIAYKTALGEVKLISRLGKPIESVPHIVAELKAWMHDCDVWDGELYVHGMEFEKIMSICKRKAKNLHPEYASMQFHVFDSITESPLFFPARWQLVADALARRPAGDEMIQTVPWLFVTYENEDQLVDMADRFAEQGFEGLILRDLEMAYEHKRSIQLIKVKRFHDAEYKIVGTQEGTKGNEVGLLTKFDIEYHRTDKDHVNEVETCEATLMGTREQRRDMLSRRDEYVGQWCTVRYQELSKKGAPRFAKVKAIREMENLEPVH